jgi:hypothetical protein
MVDMCGLILQRMLMPLGVFQIKFLLLLILARLHLVIVTHRPPGVYGYVSDCPETD